MANFSEAVKIVLKHEGGYVNSPYDAGGETKYGISKARFPNLDIKNLTLDDAVEIYRKEYWLVNRLDQINSQPVANFCLDVIVNHGRGPWLIQQTVNACGIKIKIDGIIGSKTIEAINRINPSLFLKEGVRIRKKYISYLVANGILSPKLKTGLIARAGAFSPNSVGVLPPLAMLSYFFSKFYRA